MLKLPPFSFMAEIFLLPHVGEFLIVGTSDLEKKKKYPTSHSLSKTLDALGL